MQTQIELHRKKCTGGDFNYLDIFIDIQKNAEETKTWKNITMYRQLPNRNKI